MLLFIVFIIIIIINLFILGIQNYSTYLQIWLIKAKLKK